MRVPWTARRSNQSILKEITPGCSLEGRMLKLNSNTLANSCEELTHWKRPWCWEGLGEGGGGDDRGWDAWMASPTRWTWVWVNSAGDGQGGLAIHGVTKSWTRLSDWTGLNWTELKHLKKVFLQPMGPWVHGMVLSTLKQDSGDWLVQEDLDSYQEGETREYKGILLITN